MIVHSDPAAEERAGRRALADLAAESAFNQFGCGRYAREELIAQMASPRWPPPCCAPIRDTEGAYRGSRDRFRDRLAIPDLGRLLAAPAPIPPSTVPRPLPLRKGADSS